MRRFFILLSIVFFETAIAGEVSLVDLVKKIDELGNLKELENAQHRKNKSEKERMTNTFLGSNIEGDFERSKEKPNKGEWTLGLASSFSFSSSTSSKNKYVNAISEKSKLDRIMIQRDHKTLVADLVVEIVLTARKVKVLNDNRPSFDEILANLEGGISGGALDFVDAEKFKIFVDELESDKLRLMSRIDEGLVQLKSLVNVDLPNNIDSLAAISLKLSDSASKSSFTEVLAKQAEADVQELSALSNYSKHEFGTIAGVKKNIDSNTSAYFIGLSIPLGNFGSKKNELLVAKHNADYMRQEAKIMKNHSEQEQKILTHRINYLKKQLDSKRKVADKMHKLFNKTVKAASQGAVNGFSTISVAESTLETFIEVISIEHDLTHLIVETAIQKGDL